MNWLEELKGALPDYAKDIKLNLDAVMTRSTLDAEEAEGCAIAAAMAIGNGKVLSIILNGVENETEKNAALAAAAIMAQNNIWYHYGELTDGKMTLPPQLRMNVISTFGGSTKERFEAYSLCASIVGKCHFCVGAHFAKLKTGGYSDEQLRDIGRIASVIGAVGKILI